MNLCTTILEFSWDTETVNVEARKEEGRKKEKSVKVIFEQKLMMRKINGILEQQRFPCPRKKLQRPQL